MLESAASLYTTLSGRSGTYAFKVQSMCSGGLDGDLVIVDTRDEWKENPTSSLALMDVGHTAD